MALTHPRTKQDCTHVAGERDGTARRGNQRASGPGRGGYSSVLTCLLARVHCGLLDARFRCGEDTSINVKNRS